MIAPLVGALSTGCASAITPPMVVMVSLDTVRADRLGAYGSTKGLTPNLDRFASEGVTFDDVYAQANETRYSHASLFTSRYPSELGTLDDDFSIPKTIPTLAGVLSAYGWQTAGFVGGGHLAASYRVNAGFDVWDDAAEWGSLHDTIPRALHWLDTQASDQPTFLFVHGYDAHDRYLKPTPFGYALTTREQSDVANRAIRVPGLTSMITAGRLPARQEDVEALALAYPRFQPALIAGIAHDIDVLTDADSAAIAGVYDGAVAYADAAFGVLMAGLDERGLLENAWVIVLSDHGESLGDDGSFHHRFTLNDDTLHVPLLIRPRGGGDGGRHVAGLAELNDVLPTVLDLVGETKPAKIRGRSLAGSLAHPEGSTRLAAFSESALRMVSARGMDTRVTATGLGEDNPAIADLIAATPINGVTLVATGAPEGAAALKDALVAWRRELRPAPSSDTPEAVEGSHKHGYWQVNP